MKRCPQCEFIYEDDQNLCDMDGSELDFDPRPLPRLQALATLPALLPAKSNAKGQAMPTLATVILATVLLLVYYLSAHQFTPETIAPLPATENGALPPALKVAPPAQPAATIRTESPADPLTNTPTVRKAYENPQSANTNRPSASTSRAKKTEKEPAKANQSINPTPALAPKTEDSPQSQPATVQKKDSKIGSILKKTGRLLKKPFKF